MKPKYLDNKLVFLAGATGSVGSAIMEYLLKNYPTVKIRASCRQTEPFIKHARVEYVRGDLRLREDCRRIVKGCDCAIMAASHSGGSKIMTSEPWKFINDNIFMNTQMLESFYFENVKRVIYIGTATVYQSFEGYIKEDELDMNKDPHSAYLGVAWISRFIEKLCRFWNEKAGMETICVRASNIFGPYASFNPSTSYFVPAIIRKASDKMDPFEVWGSPDVTRDVLYSEDFARAIIMLLDNDKIKFDAFNIGSGIKTTVGDVVTWSLEHARHKPSKINYDLSKPTTIKFRALDISKIKKILNWQPEYTISQGIKKTVDWWMENKSSWSK
ncbi:MAG: NAD(P)-dependent oxidoreductase [Elusimicrobia bacterium]|nr:NAD(P)-dependent oxidoreductase [Elusimicrobiota bacterium]